MTYRARQVKSKGRGQKAELRATLNPVGQKAELRSLLNPRVRGWGWVRPEAGEVGKELTSTAPRKGAAGGLIHVQDNGVARECL